MSLISSCIDSEDKRCTPDFVTNALRADSENGAIWVNAISFYAAKKDDSKVLASINALEKTSLFNERFGEKALLYAQSLESSPLNSFNMNAIEGIGKSWFSFPLYSPITQWCKKNLDVPDRANACLLLGKQLETRSKTIGMALQEMVYTSQRNIEAVSLTRKKSDKLTLNLENEQYNKLSFMLTLDDRLLRSWLKNIDFYGEIDSQKLMVEEANILYEQNENYLCSLIYNMVDSLR